MGKIDASRLKEGDVLFVGNERQGFAGIRKAIVKEVNREHVTVDMGGGTLTKFSSDTGFQVDEGSCGKGWIITGTYVPDSLPTPQQRKSAKLERKRAAQG